MRILDFRFSIFKFLNWPELPLSPTVSRARPGQVSPGQSFPHGYPILKRDKLTIDGIPSSQEDNNRRDTRLIDSIHAYTHIEIEVGSHEVEMYGRCAMTCETDKLNRNFRSCARVSESHEPAPLRGRHVEEWNA